MKALDAIEERIWNTGERLIPGVTHNTAEVVRHKSSYQFFRKVIENDLLSGCLGKPRVYILDIGCGVGHGAYMLAEIPGAQVTAIDCSEEAIVYARLHYARDNISYVVANAIDFIKGMSEFDYVVSRHSLEHIPDGMGVGARCKFGFRLMVNVPFEEPEGNPHHHVHFIREDSFEKYPNRELFYEGLDGVTHCNFPSDKAPNSIVCISSTTQLPEVGPQLSFPVPAWQPEFLQGKWLETVERESELDALAQQQSIRDREITTREGRLANRESELAVREAELANRESRSVLRETEFATREAGLATREAGLAARETELAARETELAARETELAAREAGLAAREAGLAARGAELAAREADVATREAHYGLREAELSVREGESNERTREIRVLEEELAKLESTTRLRDRQLLDQQAKLDGLIQQFESRLLVRVYRKVKRLF